MTAHGTTRRRMLECAIGVMRERGATGVTIGEVLARSGAPRGSVYHHFPHGRAQLLAETVTYAGDTFTGMIERAATRGADAVVVRVVAFWSDVLTESDFRAGCPIVSTAATLAEDDPGLADTAREIIRRWQSTIAVAVDAGRGEREDAEQVALTVLATLDGAVNLCRTLRTLEPLQVVEPRLRALVSR